MKHMKSIDLGRTASRYSSLRTYIIDMKLHELIQFRQPRTTAPAAWPNQTVDAESVFVQGAFPNDIYCSYMISDHEQAGVISSSYFGA